MRLFHSRVSMVKSRPLSVTRKYYHLHNHGELNVCCLLLALHYPRKRTLNVDGEIESTILTIYSEHHVCLQHPRSQCSDTPVRQSRDEEWKFKDHDVTISQMHTASDCNTAVPVSVRMCSWGAKLGPHTCQASTRPLSFVLFLFILRQGCPRPALYSVLQAGFELQKSLPQPPEQLGVHRCHQDQLELCFLPLDIHLFEG